LPIQAQRIDAADADFAFVQVEQARQVRVVAREQQAAGAILDKRTVAVGPGAGQVAAQGELGGIGIHADTQGVRPDVDVAAGGRRIAGGLDAGSGGQRDGPAEVHVVLDEAQGAAVGDARRSGQRLRGERDGGAAAMQFQRRAVFHRGARRPWCPARWPRGSAAGRS
jgi:hypothetical protein